MIDVASVMEWVVRLGGLVGIGTLAGIVWNRQAGVKADSREARRDTIADRDSLVDRLQIEIARLDDDLTAARHIASEAISGLKTEQAQQRKEFDELRRQYELEHRWNLLLIDHIAQGRGWPPVPRPTD